MKNFFGDGGFIYYRENLSLPFIFTILFICYVMVLSGQRMVESDDDMSLRRRPQYLARNDSDTHGHQLEPAP